MSLTRTRKFDAWQQDPRFGGKRQVVRGRAGALEGSILYLALPPFLYSCLKGDSNSYVLQVIELSEPT